MSKHIFFFLVICCSFTLDSKIILWDLGGVLFEPDKIGVGQAVGLSYFAQHAFWDMRSPNIQKKLFDLLDQFESKQAENERIAGSATGFSLPSVMCRWQKGTITGNEITKQVTDLISFLYKYDYFDSREHMILFKRCVKAMFDPNILARNVHPIEEGIKLLSASSRMRDKEGKKLHRQFVFSNWDHISFEMFKKRNGRVFKHFEEIVISGHIKHIKPHIDAFNYLIKTYNLNPKECILIDDQEVNVRGARRAGMKAVLIRNSDYHALEQDLRALGVLE